MRFVRCTALATALFMLAPSAVLAQQPPSTSPGASDKQNQAEALASRAFEAYNKEDYTAALSLYQQALDLAPAAALYFNIASIYDKKLSDAKHAIEYYRKAARAQDASPELIVKAGARVEVLSQELAAQQPAAPPEGASKSAAPDKGTATGPSASAPKENSGKALRTAGLVVGGVGVITLGTGLVFGLEAKLKLDSARKVCTGRLCKTVAGLDDMNAAHNAATISTILSAAGGAVTALGLGLFIFAPRNTESAPPAAAVTLSPMLGPTRAGISLSGSFF